MIHKQIFARLALKIDLTKSDIGNGDCIHDYTYLII